MCQYHSLKTLNDDWSECYWPVVIQAGRLALLGEGDNGCGLEAGGSSAVTEGKVEDGGENFSQLVGTRSESPPRDVVWCLMRWLVEGRGVGWSWCVCASSLCCGWRSQSG